MTGPVAFAVVDVETTGLFARRNDRVIELGVVVVDAAGERLDDFETLVNPGRDLGPTHIHGVRGRDVRDAPAFAAIVGDLCARLAGCVLVAHNARFDRDFLAEEFARAGFEFPVAPWLCTMEIGAAMTGCSRLVSCCEELGIDLGHAHAAVDDAAAAAQVLACWLQHDGAARQVKALIDSTPVPQASRWPRIAPSGDLRRRSSPRPVRQPSFIASLLAQLPASGRQAAGAVAAYLELLDRALEDRSLTAAETEALHDLAAAWGLGRDDVEAIHWEYMRGLASLAWLDGQLTDAERADLEDAAEALGITSDRLSQLFEAPVAEPTGVRHDGLAGRSVCFTGQLTCTIDGQLITRELAQRLASERGLLIQAGVTKKLDVLVVSDPESLSGKARKARDYGTRIIVERAFWQDIGVPVD